MEATSSKTTKEHEHSGELLRSDRFSICRQLGRGGMGVVYEAVDRRHNLRVALKMLRQVSPQALYRFKREFRALQDLQHPNLVRLGELVEEHGQYFFTMEHIEGTDLDGYLGLQSATSGSQDLTPPTMQLPDPAALPAAPPREGAEPPKKRAELPCSELRLRAVLPQLAAGLCALHAAGKVHRDVKPSNIRITREGRVVLLDFGVLAELSETGESTDLNIVGTAVYMAPEQAAAALAGPAADWYSVGVVLYEALTGRPPHEGKSLQILIDKQQRDPPRPRELNSAVPADLDELAMDLLCRRPEARPVGPEVLRRLGVQDAETALAIGRGYGRRAVFVGRQAELAELEAALGAARQGNTVAVFVRGASGMGKSELLRRFIRPLQSNPEAVVLCSRCYERESVPYKALDSAIDGLSHYMRKLPRPEAAELVPRYAALLPRVFPVLERVPVIGQAPAARVAIQDPVELQSRAFAALRELLSRLAERRLLVLVIDDLQWADADSWKLLAELLRPPDQVPLLLLASTRQLQRPQPQAGQPAEAEALGCEIRELGLGPLVPEEAAALAAELLKEAGASGLADRAAAIAEEAGGHPIFIEELSHYAIAAGQSPAERLKLDAAIQARVCALDPKARLALELVCLADAALPQELICTAAKAVPARFAGDLHVLRAARLVRTSGGRQRDGLESYHDRVRVAVLASLDEKHLQGLHERLATVLTDSETARLSPELLMRHLAAAGHHEKASLIAEQAAPRAAEALAFERAAELYAAAMALGKKIGEPKLHLLRPLAEALGNAGRGKEAADIFQKASEEEGERKSQLYCMRRAAELYLASGYSEQGIAAAVEAVKKVGLYFPSGTFTAVLILLWVELLLWLKRYRIDSSAFPATAAEDLDRCRVCLSCATSLPMQDMVLARTFQARGALLALRLGNHEEATRALVAEVGFLSSRGRSGLTRAKQLVEEVAGRVQAAGSAALTGRLIMVRGMIDYFSSRFSAGVAKLEEAQQLYLQSSQVQWPEVNLARTVQLLCLVGLGSPTKLAERFRTIRQDARRRGDRYTDGILQFRCHYVWLAADDVPTARQEIEQSSWRHPKGTHDLLRLYERLARAEVELYDDQQGAYDKVFYAVNVLLRSVVNYTITSARNEGAWAAGRLALAKALDCPEPAPLRRFARRRARQIEREPDYGGVYAPLLRAAICSQEHDEDGTVRALRAALGLAAHNEMALIEAAVKRRLGEVLGGDEGKKLCAAGSEWMTREGVKDPERMTSLIVAGLRQGR